MPWKLLFYLVLIGVILVFVGLNLTNTSDISLGFVTFEDVPVFLSLFAAFAIGVGVAIPYAVQASSRKTKARTEKRMERIRARDDKRAAKQAKKDGGDAPATGQLPESTSDRSGDGGAPTA